MNHKIFLKHLKQNQENVGSRYTPEIIKNFNQNFEKTL